MAPFFNSSEFWRFYCLNIKTEYYDRCCSIQFALLRKDLKSKQIDNSGKLHFIYLHAIIFILHVIVMIICVPHESYTSYDLREVT